MLARGADLPGTEGWSLSPARRLLQVTGTGGLALLPWEQRLRGKQGKCQARSGNLQGFALTRTEVGVIIV
jgi:hypothetical protein